MDIKAIFLGLAFAFMWSSAFTSGHIIVSSSPPLTALALRFLISGRSIEYETLDDIK